jgi:hypothetical protein
MKRTACALTLMFAPFIAIGCDSNAPTAITAPSQPNPAPPAKNRPGPAARGKKLPGIHSPVTPTKPRAKF